MYMSEKDIKALKIVMKNVKITRDSSISARSIRQLSRALKVNEKRVQRQRREVKRITSEPRTTKQNNIW